MGSNNNNKLFELWTRHYHQAKKHQCILLEQVQVGLAKEEQARQKNSRLSDLPKRI